MSADRDLVIATFREVCATVPLDYVWRVGPFKTVKGEKEVDFDAGGHIWGLRHWASGRDVLDLQWKPRPGTRIPAGWRSTIRYGSFDIIELTPRNTFRFTRSPQDAGFDSTRYGSTHPEQTPPIEILFDDVRRGVFDRWIAHVCRDPEPEPALAREPVRRSARQRESLPEPEADPDDEQPIVGDYPPAVPEEAQLISGSYPPALPGAQSTTSKSFARFLDFGRALSAIERSGGNGRGGFTR